MSLSTHPPLPSPLYSWLDLLFASVVSFLLSFNLFPKASYHCGALSWKEALAGTLKFIGWLTLLQLLQTLLWSPFNHPWVGWPLPVSLAVLILAALLSLEYLGLILWFSNLLFLGLENCFLPHRCWYHESYSCGWFVPLLLYFWLHMDTLSVNVFIDVIHGFLALLT